jgi:hypothetical protein
MSEPYKCRVLAIVRQKEEQTARALRQSRGGDHDFWPWQEELERVDRELREAVLAIPPDVATEFMLSIRARMEQQQAAWLEIVERGKIARGEQPSQ